MNLEHDYIQDDIDDSTGMIDFSNFQPRNSNSYEDNDVGYFSLFRGSKSNENESEELKKCIERCIESRSESFEISGKTIISFPREVLSFNWLQTLNLENTGINTLSEFPPNLVNLIIKHNNIKILDGSVIPSSVKILVFTDNSTTEIVGLKEGLTEVALSSNKLSNICQIPMSVVILDISDNKVLTSIPNLLSHVNLRGLLINNTSICSIDDTLPDTLEHLETCRCMLQIIKHLPKNLVTWKSYISCIENIECEFPENLLELDLFNNSLKTIPELPQKIKTVDLSNNSLISIPNIPQSIEMIDLKQNDKLKTEDIQKIEKDYPEIKILYDASPPDYFSHYGSDDNYESLLNGFNFSNFSLSYGNSQANRITEYSETNPHYVPLKKTYCI
jgi:hypothetical protein